MHSKQSQSRCKLAHNQFIFDRMAIYDPHFYSDTPNWTTRSGGLYYNQNQLMGVKNERHTNQFKFTVSPEAAKGLKTINEIASLHTEVFQHLTV